MHSSAEGENTKSISWASLREPSALRAHPGSGVVGLRLFIDISGVLREEELKYISDVG